MGAATQPVQQRDLAGHAVDQPGRRQRSRRGGEAGERPLERRQRVTDRVEFARLGMAFKARPLRAAAEACLEFGPKWAELDPTTLVGEVQNVPRIGPWTAGATVADLTNDYTLYPFADLVSLRRPCRPYLGETPRAAAHLAGC